jgi:hypothetical protein
VYSSLTGNQYPSNFCYLSDAASMANCPRKTPAEI